MVSKIMTILKFSLLLLFIFIFSYSVVESKVKVYIKPETIEMIKSDSPSFIDLMVYIPLLNRMVEYCEQHKDGLSINLVHGLFLLNVNLRQYVKDDIPEDLRTDLQKLLARSDQLQKEFNDSKGSQMKKMLAALASNATGWSSRLPRLNYDLLKQTLSHGDYPRWKDYLEAVEDVDNGMPSPKQSDKCVGSLMESEENLSDDPGWLCEVPKKCYKSVINGTDFGYWITHRLIFLLFARLGRNCAIFSVTEDLAYRTQFCEQMYREAEYIASNDFGLVDLLLEQIVLCALDGHAQFLRRSWLVRILEYNQPGGCFQLDKLKPNETPDIENCDGHAVGVALGTFSAAVRFILENQKRFID